MVGRPPARRGAERLLIGRAALRQAGPVMAARGGEAGPEARAEAERNPFSFCEFLRSQSRGAQLPHVPHERLARSRAFAEPFFDDPRPGRAWEPQRDASLSSGEDEEEEEEDDGEWSASYRPSAHEEEAAALGAPGPAARRDSLPDLSLPPPPAHGEVSACVDTGGGSTCVCTHTWGALVCQGVCTRMGVYTYTGCVRRRVSTCVCTCMSGCVHMPGGCVCVYTYTGCVRARTSGSVFRYMLGCACTSGVYTRTCGRCTHIGCVYACTSGCACAWVVCVYIHMGGYVRTCMSGCLHACAHVGAFVCQGVCV